MISRRIALRSGLGAVVALAAGHLADGHAQTSSAGPVTRKEILRQALPNMPGKEVVVVTVEFAPGAGSPRHCHPSSVFVYVAQGAVVSQLGPQAPVTYREGEMFYEPPQTVHATARNASTTAPARLVAFFVADQGRVPALEAFMDELRRAG